jgi:hypothetical protein
MKRGQAFRTWLRVGRIASLAGLYSAERTHASLQELELPVAPPPVDIEVAVERHDSPFAVDLAASNETRVGERHRSIRVLQQERLDVRPMLLDGDRHLVHAPASERHDLGRGARMNLPQQETGLGQNRLATSKRRRARGEQPACPRVIDIVRRQQRLGLYGLGTPESARRRA